MHLSNPEPQALAVKLQSYAPRELAVRPDSLEVELPAGQGRDLELAVRSVDGQPGAQYPLLLVSASDQDGLHSEKVDEAKVKILPGQNLFRQHLNWWLMGLAALAAWIAGRQLWRARRRP